VEVLNIYPEDINHTDLVLTMIGTATEDHKLDDETVKIKINTNEYDQGKNVSMEFDVVHNLSEKHLTPTTTTVKRGSSMFMSGNFKIIEETYSLQLTYMSFVSLPSTKNILDVPGVPSTITKEIMTPSPKNKRKTSATYKIKSKKIPRLSQIAVDSLKLTANEKEIDK
jgi:hypothetical protein